jgi:hypothetical protein
MLFLCQLFHFQKPEWRGLKQLQRGKTFIVQNLYKNTVIYFCCDFNEHVEIKTMKPFFVGYPEFGEQIFKKVYCAINILG